MRHLHLSSLPSPTTAKKSNKAIAQIWGGGVGAGEGSINVTKTHVVFISSSSPPPTLAGHSPAQAQNARVCLVSVNQAISCANLLSWHM